MTSMDVHSQYRQNLIAANSYEKPSTWVHTIAEVAGAAPGKAMSAAGKADFHIELVGASDKQRVVEFLRHFFFKDEPLNIDVQLLGPDGSGRCQELEDYSTSCLQEGLSVVATSASGQLVGVCLNGLHEPGHLPEMEARVAECENARFRKILNLLTTVEREAAVFALFPDVHQVMEVHILSVDAAWRGQGLAKALMDRSRDLAKERGYQMMRVDCSSHFSARAAERMGMECVYTLRYDEHVGDDGEPVFRPGHPHTSVKTYVERLNQ